MILERNEVPVVVVHAALGALSIFRTLGYLGVEVHCVTNDKRALALRSRYCRSSHYLKYDSEPQSRLVEALLDVAGRLREKPILIATSDETAIAVANHFDQLSGAYRIAQNSGPIVATLADKMTMFDLARQHGVPVPRTMLPRSEQEARQYAAEVQYPVMLKGAMGNRLHQRTGKKMVEVHNADELLEQYRILEDPEAPNLMIQELIPGGDDQVYIFNGYFDAGSNCLAGFTGRKIRQFPVHVGCASLGECCTVQEVSDITTDFMKKIGYRGILDIGYRKDPRDGKYKVLDINPRVGQAFRLFVSEDNLDVVRALYLDQTGQRVPSKVVPREGRRWMIEDYDIVSSYDYWQEGNLSFFAWLRSFRHLQEGCWFSWRDPIPFIGMLGRLLGQAGRWLRNRLAGSPR